MKMVTEDLIQKASEGNPSDEFVQMFSQATEGFKAFDSSVGTSSSPRKKGESATPYKYLESSGNRESESKPRLSIRGSDANGNSSSPDKRYQSDHLNI